MRGARRSSASWRKRSSRRSDARRRYACAGLRRARIERQIAVAFVGRVSEAPPGNMLGSEPDFLPETVIGFLVLSPGKRFSRVTSAYSVLPLRGAAPVLRGAGSVMERQRLPYGSLSGRRPGEGKHCREVFYVICGFSVFCAPG